METKIRVIRQENNNDEYCHLYFQFLKPKSYSDYLEISFTISWQSDRRSDHWYAMNAELRNNDIESIEYCLKIMKYIKANCDTTRPEEIFHVLGCEQYSYNGDFIPVTLDGCTEFLISKDGSGYKTVYSFGTDNVYKEITRLQMNVNNTANWQFEIKKQTVNLKPVNITR